mmetsp:Transcript_17870/g.42991  ORF Transcript_17870/g.42991 Transcript_17870/m.42991 type:complete len:101 (-) Transcript_17870:51-353(-)
MVLAGANTSFLSSSFFKLYFWGEGISNPQPSPDLTDGFSNTKLWPYDCNQSQILHTKQLMRKTSSKSLAGYCRPEVSYLHAICDSMTANSQYQTRADNIR